MSEKPRDKLKKNVFAKSGGLCWYCGEPAEQMDYFVPEISGGKLNLKNIVPVCKWCNKSKRGLSLPEWRVKRSMALGMLFTTQQTAYWRGQGIKLPIGQLVEFYFEKNGFGK
jgi:hypothetical protein